MRIKEEKIEVVKTLLKPKSIRVILVFLNFANFYKSFIQNFDKITTLFTLILQTTSKSCNIDFISIWSNNNKVKDILGGKIKFLSKAKRLENLAKSKKLTKAKANKVFETDFFTFKT